MHKGRVLPGKACKVNHSMIHWKSAAEKVNHSMIHFLLYCGQRYLNKIHASDFPDKVNLIKIHSAPPPKSAPCRAPPGGGHVTRICRKGRATGPRLAACGPARRRRIPCRETNLLMLKLYFPPRCRLRWLIPGLLPAGLSLLAGASKAGKSWLCLWLCLQLTRGGEIWGRITQPQTVLYLCLEDTYARIQGRLFRLTEDSVPSRLYFQTGSCAIGDGLELQIEKFLSQHPETGLVVIDTLQKVRTADPNNGAYASDYQDMSALKFLADRRGIGLLLVHHLRKQGASDPFQQISGSNGLMGAADTIWLLQRQRMSDTARLLVTGRDMDSCTLHLQTRDCIWQLLEEESAEEQVRKAVPDYLWRAADFVRRADSWTGTATELLTAAGITGVQPNQFTRKLVEHFYTVFAPRGIRYQSRRTSNTRLLCFTCDTDDGHDGSDDDTGRSPLPSGTAPAGEEGAAPVPSSSSSPSPGPHHGSEHGLCVADGHPFAAADTAAPTGTAPNPDFSREAAS